MELVGQTGEINAIIDPPQIAFDVKSNNRSTVLYYVSFKSGTVKLWNKDLKSVKLSHLEGNELTPKQPHDT